MNRLQAVLSIFLLAAISASAQTQAINGSIRGRVADAAGASVPGAKVTVLNEATGFTRTLNTDDDGYYVFPNLHNFATRKLSFLG